MEQEKRDIAQLDDIKLLVDEFYTKVREDELLAPIFNTRIGERWPEHLDKMYRFWQTVLLEDHTYFGSPFTPHAHMPIDKTHFDQWLKLFYQTLDEHFTGDKLIEAKWRAEKMAQMFQMKIEHYRQNPTAQIL